MPNSEKPGAGRRMFSRPFNIQRKKSKFTLSPFRPFHLWKGKHFAPLAGILIALIIFLLSLSQTAQIFEWRTLDLRFKKREIQPIKSDLTIVFIGDDSIRAFGRWPWPWDYHALLIDVLQRHGAKAIVFDILFAEKPAGTGREILSLSLKSAGNVYLCSYFNSLEKSPVPGRPHSGYTLTEPLTALKENAKGTGHCNSIPDEDGITRRIPLLIRNVDGYYPSTALSVALDQLDVPISEISLEEGKRISIPVKRGRPLEIPIDHEGQTMVNFAGDMSTFEAYSFREVLQSDQFPEKAVVDLENLRGKIVLVGVTFAGNTDIRPTPLSKAYPMLCILGNTIDNILQRNFLSRSPLLWRIITVIILGGLTGFLSYVLRPFFSLSSSTLLTGAYIWFAFHRFARNQVWVDIMAPLLIILANYLVMTTVQYIQNRREKMHYLEYLNYMNDLVGSTSDAIVSFDMEGRIVTWNKGAEKIFGRTERASLMKNWDLMVSADDRETFGEALREVYQKESPQSLEIMAYTRGHRGFPASMNLSPVKDSGGTMVGVSCIAQDLTEKKKMIEMLVKSEKMAELGRLGSGIVHEIKNPLTSIMMLTGMVLSMDSLDDKSKKYISIIDQEAQRILRLSQNILSFARPRKPEMKTVELKTVIEETAALVEYELKKNHVTLDTSFKDGGVKALGDHEKLKQVFLNLIINAVHAMDGGGTIFITTGFAGPEGHDIPEGFASQTAGQPVSENDAVVTIRDEGCGIVPDILEKIFEPFFSTKGEGKGTGLGLYISKNIIAEHRGSLTVASRSGDGTTFFVALPVGKPETTDESEEAVSD